MRLRSLTGQRFSRLVVGARIGGTYECLCDCGKTAVVDRGNLTSGNTKSCGCLRSICKQGSLNPSWKGNTVSYNALHEWVRSRYVKPDLCEHCAAAPPHDLANISGRYLRELRDWWYLCRRCHMEIDGRNQKLRDSGRSRKIYIPPCAYCGKTYYRRSRQRTAKFCSRTCFEKAGGKSNHLVVRRHQ